MARIDPTDPLVSVDVRERTIPRTKLGKVKRVQFSIGEDYEDPKVIYKYFRNMAARYGDGFVIARRQDGNLWSWGCSAADGQLGLGTTSATSTPTQITSASADFSRAFAPGDAHTLALDVSGAPWAWGDNQYGQLGDGTITSKSTPNAIQNLLGYAVAAGLGHSLLIDTDDDLWTWGLNTYGQLGDGTLTDKSVPVMITVGSSANPSRVRKIDAGEYFSVALDQKNQAWTWGDNVYGQLGIGVAGGGGGAGGQVGNDGNTVLLLNCDGTDGHTTFTDTSSGGGHGTATVYNNAQGDTSYKKWGTASLYCPSTNALPTDLIEFPNSTDFDIPIWSNYTLDLWVKHVDHSGLEIYTAFAQNYYQGELWYLFNVSGGGQEYMAFAWYTFGGGGTQILVQSGAGVNITDTDWHHIALCKVGNDYGLYLDGQQIGYDNTSFSDTVNSGKLGIGATCCPSCFTPVSRQFTGWIDEYRMRTDNYFGAAPVVGLTDTIDVPTGPYITETEPTSAAYRESPVPVIGDNAFIETAAGPQTGYGIDKNGVAWAWGDGTYGQLGSSEPSAAAPVSVAGRHSFIQIAGGGREAQGHACGLKADGSVWCWGRNHRSQLGVCDQTDRTSPTSVKGRHSFIDIWASKGGFNTIAIKADGSVWVWGASPFCDGTDYCSPVSIPDFNLITLNILGRGYLENHSLFLET